jgi:hypothetical protein
LAGGFRFDIAGRPCYFAFMLYRVPSNGFIEAVSPISRQQATRSGRTKDWLKFKNPTRRP